MHTSEQILQDDIDKLQLKSRTQEECAELARTKAMSVARKLRQIASIMRYITDNQSTELLDDISLGERILCAHRSLGAASNAIHAANSVKKAIELIEAVQNTYEEASASKENEQG
jgi:hypothetical protein